MLVSLSLSSFCATLMRSNFLHERSGDVAAMALHSYHFFPNLRSISVEIRKKSENALHITSCNSMSNSVQQCPTSAHSSHDFQLSQAPCNQPKSGKRAAIHLLNYHHHSQGCLNRFQKAVHIFVFPLHQSDSFVRFCCILSNLNLWEARSAGICRAFFMGAEKRTCWSLPKLKKLSLSQSDSIQPISRLLV